MGDAYTADVTTAYLRQLPQSPQDGGVVSGQNFASEQTRRDDHHNAGLREERQEIRALLTKLDEEIKRQAGELEDIREAQMQAADAAASAPAAVAQEPEAGGDATPPGPQHRLNSSLNCKRLATPPKPSRALL